MVSFASCNFMLLICCARLCFEPLPFPCFLFSAFFSLFFSGSLFAPCRIELPFLLLSFCLLYFRTISLAFGCQALRILRFICVTVVVPLGVHQAPKSPCYDEESIHRLPRPSSLHGKCLSVLAFWVVVKVQNFLPHQSNQDLSIGRYRMPRVWSKPSQTRQRLLPTKYHISSSGGKSRGIFLAYLVMHCSIS